MLKNNSNKAKIKDMIGTVMIAVGVLFVALSLLLMFVHNKRISDEKKDIATHKAMFISGQVSSIDATEMAEDENSRTDDPMSMDNDVEIIELDNVSENSSLVDSTDGIAEDDNDISKNNTKNGFLFSESGNSSQEMVDDDNLSDGIDENNLMPLNAQRQEMIDKQPSEVKVTQPVVNPASSKPLQEQPKPKASSDKKKKLIDSAVAYIDIQKIEVSAPIFPGTSKKELRKGAGVVKGTDMPSKDGNRCCVIAGHRGGRNAELNFFRADELDIGDTATVYLTGYELTYTVVQKIVIKDDDWTKFTRESGINKLILMTCHPYPVNVDRLLVICELTATKPI